EDQVAWPRHEILALRGGGRLTRTMRWELVQISFGALLPSLQREVTALRIATGESAKRDATLRAKHRWGSSKTSASLQTSTWHSPGPSAAAKATEPFVRMVLRGACGAEGEDHRARRLTESGSRSLAFKRALRPSTLH